MSKDTTVAILVTKGKNGTEYRVANVQAFGNIWYYPDHPAESPVLNRELVVALFGGAEVYHNLVDAQRAARQMVARIPVEHGIRMADHSAIEFLFPDNEPS